jgi:hypothetical protein
MSISPGFHGNYVNGCRYLQKSIAMIHSCLLVLFPEQFNMPKKLNETFYVYMHHGQVSIH